MFTGKKAGDALEAIGGSKLGLALGVIVASAGRGLLAGHAAIAARGTFATGF